MNIRTSLRRAPVGLLAAMTLTIGTAGLSPTAAAADSSEAPTATVDSGLLSISGTNGADTITIGVAADPANFKVDFGGTVAPRVFPRASFRAIQVSLGRGDDTFAVNPLGQFSDDQLTVDDRVHRQHLVQRLDLGVLRRQVAKAAPPYPDAPGLADGERPDAVPGDLELVQG